MDKQMMDLEARNLEERFRSVNQAEFARRFGVPGGASMISQHIKARRPINMGHALAYARGFGVSLADISPRLADQARRAVKTLPSDPEQLDANEAPPKPLNMVPPSLKEALPIVLSPVAYLTQLQLGAFEGLIAKLRGHPEWVDDCATAMLSILEPANTMARLGNRAQR
jgi:hypothetical protein